LAIAFPDDKGYFLLKMTSLFPQYARTERIWGYPGFPGFLMNPFVSERNLLGAVGYPSRVSRKGKAPPLEWGRGKYSPPASPERVTAKAVRRRDKGVHLKNAILSMKS